jgi:Mn2+/Fe2+ NRAMP family transporter
MDEPTEIRAARLAYETALIERRTARTYLLCELVGLATAITTVAGVAIAAALGVLGLG